VATASFRTGRLADCTIDNHSTARKMMTTIWWGRLGERKPALSIGYTARKWPDSGAL